jgi:copper homeostasis protein
VFGGIAARPSERGLAVIVKNGVLIEVCVDSVESALAAERGGAMRLEVCSNLLEGGVTPSLGMIKAVRRNVSIALNVMIRPRGGDFCYSDEEFAIMRQDITSAKQAGADGVVLGVLDVDGNVDTNRTAQLVDSAAPLTVTFHRAIDMTRNLVGSLQTLKCLGVTRILTSGGEQTAIEGRHEIARLVCAAKDKIAVMAGSGIREHNVCQLVDATGVREIHVSLNGREASPMRYRNGKISMGIVKDREYQRFGVLQERVERLLAAVSKRRTDS